MTLEEAFAEFEWELEDLLDIIQSGGFIREHFEPAKTKAIAFGEAVRVQAVHSERVRCGRERLRYRLAALQEGEK